MSAEGRRATSLGGMWPLTHCLCSSEQPHSHTHMGSAVWSLRGNVQIKVIKWKKDMRLPGRLAESTRKSWKKVAVDVFDQYTLHKYRKFSKNKNIIKIFLSNQCSKWNYNLFWNFWFYSYMWSHAFVLKMNCKLKRLPVHPSEDKM